MTGGRLGGQRDEGLYGVADFGERGGQPPVRFQVIASGPFSLYSRIQSRIVECRFPVTLDHENALSSRVIS